MPESDKTGSRSRNATLAMVALMAAVLGVVLFAGWLTDQKRQPDSNPAAPKQPRDPRAYRMLPHGNVTLWWRPVPEYFQSKSLDTGPHSNIRPRDYVGPDRCKRCHPKQYQGWSKHSHGRMNALVSKQTPRGDFSGKADINYLGGRAKFSRTGAQYRMQLVRGNIRRTYQITQTIGSRFYESYAGYQLDGPEPKDHEFYHHDFVLPLKYWFDGQQWVPVMNVDDEAPDEERRDPYKSPYPVKYSVGCSHCHRTYPMGDWFLRRPERLEFAAPVRFSISISGYLGENHPELWDATQNPAEADDEEIARLLEELKVEGPAVTHGVSCESCHLGCREHAEKKLPRPHFFPSGPHLFALTRLKNNNQAAPDLKDDPAKLLGRNRANVNWACSRCHNGIRPQFAAGMSTFNSAEYNDAMAGACYSELTCVHCHNPHQAIGHEWSLSPAQDDALCLKCHGKFEKRETLLAHTHHSAESPGSRCMNCHMPRINEGLQDVVRTHTIFSPTEPRMIEANHPNACNLCHVDRSIDWTIMHLKEWYGAAFSEIAVGSSHPDRSQSAALGWLKSRHQSVRLVGADALTRAKAESALPQLLNALDDPYLRNRLFAVRGLERMLGLRLADLGYYHYMLADERREPLARIRKAVIQKP